MTIADSTLTTVQYSRCYYYVTLVCTCDSSIRGYARDIKAAGTRWQHTMEELDGGRRGGRRCSGATLTAAARFEDRMAHYAWAVLLISSGHDCIY